jgi:two-component system response regulator CpxR
VGDVSVNISAHLARRGSTDLDLTSLELRLLEMLLRHAGTVVTREQISQEALGRALMPYDRSVDTHMSNLRRKLTGGGALEDPIKTVRGTGYIFAREAEPA